MRNDIQIPLISKPSLANLLHDIDVEAIERVLHHHFSLYHKSILAAFFTAYVVLIYITHDKAIFFSLVMFFISFIYHYRYCKLCPPVDNWNERVTVITSYIHVLRVDLREAQSERSQIRMSQHLLRLLASLHEDKIQWEKVSTMNCSENYATDPDMIEEQKKEALHQKDEIFMYVIIPELMWPVIFHTLLICMIILLDLGRFYVGTTILPLAPWLLDVNFITFFSIFTYKVLKIKRDYKELDALINALGDSVKGGCVAEL